MCRALLIRWITGSGTTVANRARRDPGLASAVAGVIGVVAGVRRRFDRAHGVPPSTRATASELAVGPAHPTAALQPQAGPPRQPGIRRRPLDAGARLAWAAPRRAAAPP